MLYMMILLSASVAQPWDASSVWCFQDNDHAGTGVEMRGSVLSPLRRDRISWARGALRNRSVVQLSSRQGRELRIAGAGTQDVQGRYYLVRAVVYAPIGATSADLLEAAQGARFELEWFPRDARVRISTIQPTPPPRIVYAWNFPMILISRVPIRQVAVACYPIR